MSSPAIDGLPVVLTGLTKRFGDAVLAVDGLTLSVEPGQVFGLLGPNGCGKTTTMKLLLGLIRPTAGSAHLFGHQVRASHPVLRSVGALVDGPAFVPHLTGMRNLELYWNAGGDRMETANLNEALEIAGLGDAIHRKVGGYSTGMLQRLGIAQALLNRPELLVLDEPTSGLDPVEIREIRALISRVAQLGATVLFSSHILAEVEQVCTHAAVMDRGRLVAQGRVDELTSATTWVYLELDDVEAAVSALRAHDGVQQIVREPVGLSLEVDGVSRKQLVALLVNAGVGVETVTSRHKLEDAFLKILAEES